MVLLQSWAEGEGNKCESDVDFEVVEFGEREDMVVKGFESGIMVVVEKLDWFGGEGKERAGGQDGRRKRCDIDGGVKVVVEKLVTFLNDDGLRATSNEKKEVDESSGLRFLV